MKGKNQTQKSPWRFLFLGAALAGGWMLLEKLAVWILYLWLEDPLLTASEASTVGIIGGADGPTAIFITGPNPGAAAYLVPILLIAAGIWGYRKLKRHGEKP